MQRCHLQHASWPRLVHCRVWLRAVQSPSSAAYFCSSVIAAARLSGGGGVGPASGAVNWNCDTDSTDTAVASDINNDGLQNTLTGFDDWTAVRLPFQATRDFEDGVHTTLLFETSDFELARVTNMPPVAAICPVGPVEWLDAG